MGAECHIGRGVALQGSCLHSGVRVDDNCRVSSTVLAEQVVVRSHARVEVSQLCGSLRTWGGSKEYDGGIPVHLLPVCRPSHRPAHPATCRVSLATFRLAVAQTGVILAKRVVVDTAHCVPAGMHVSLAQHRTGSSVASDDELEWQEAGVLGTARTTSASCCSWVPGVVM